MDIDKVTVLIDSLFRSSTWVLLIITILCGALGGITHRVTENADSKTKMNYWKNILVGSVAALAVLYILTPPDAVKLIALSIVAGYAGKSLLDLLQSKLESAIKDSKINDFNRSINDLSNQISQINIRTKSSISQNVDPTIENYNTNIKSIADKLELMKTIFK
jgi:hypothetical protein